MDTLWQDLRYALRTLRRQPGLTLTLIGILSVGIAANSTIFSVVNAVLLNPQSLQSWRNPDRVLMLWEKNSALSLMLANQMPVRPLNYRAWREQQHSFSYLSAWRDETVTLTDPDNKHQKPELVETGFATADLFSLLGVEPQIGRLFAAAKSARTATDNHVALLSDELYRSRFNSNPHIVGATVFVSGQPFTLVGVLPPNVSFPAIWGGSEQKKPRLWLPLEMHPGARQDQESSLLVFGRLKEGISITQARAEMRTIERRLASTPLEEGGFGINLQTLREANTDPSSQRAALLLQAAVGFVLLIACANAGNLLLGRAIARDKEMVVRKAIGAGHWRLVRQTLTESLLLSCGAAGVGLLLSLIGIRLLVAIAPSDAFALQGLRIDRDVLLFTALTAIVAALVFGMIPASHCWQTNINEVLNRSARSVSGSSNRLRAALVIAEISLSLVLVVGAGLMIRSLSAFMNTDLGFRRDHLLVMRLALPPGTYNSPSKIARFNNQLAESVRSASGIRAAALTSALPMKAVSQSTFEMPGQPSGRSKLPVTNWARVSDQYFETLQLLLLHGRTFTHSEVVAADPAVAVVNHAFVKKFLRGTDPLGRQVLFANEQGANTSYRVVGVVADERQMGPENEQGPELYLPGQHLTDLLLVARTTGDPLLLANIVKQQVWNIDKDQPIKEVASEDAALREFAAPRRFTLFVLLVFALLALLLAALGLYSVLAYTVTLRTREIGIRVAIGAQPRDVALHILRNGLSLSLAGVGIGIAAALALSRYVSSFLYGVSAADPGTFAVVAGLLILVAAIASYVPAIRAAKVDPIEALRIE